MDIQNTKCTSQNAHHTYTLYNYAFTFGTMDVHFGHVGSVAESPILTEVQAGLVVSMFATIATIVVCFLESADQTIKCLVLFPLE